MGWLGPGAALKGIEDGIGGGGDWIEDAITGSGDETLFSLIGSTIELSDISVDVSLIESFLYMYNKINENTNISQWYIYSIQQMMDYLLKQRYFLMWINKTLYNNQKTFQNNCSSLIHQDDYR